MFLLSWHGSLITAQHASQTLGAAADPANVTPNELFSIFTSLDNDLVALAAITARGLNGERLLCAPKIAGVRGFKKPRERIVSLQRDGHFLSAEPKPGAAVVWNWPNAEIWQAFMLLSGSEVAFLKLIFTHNWHTPANTLVRRDWISLAPGFGLRLDEYDMPLADFLDLNRRSVNDLETSANRSLPEATFVIHDALGEPAEMRIAERVVSPPPDEYPLVRTDAARRASPLPAGASLGDASDVVMTLPSSEPEVNLPPTFVSIADAQHFFRGFPPDAAGVGIRHAELKLYKQTSRFVVLKRFGEGVIFSEDGASTSPGFLCNMSILPRSVRGRCDQFIADRRSLAQLPIYAGTYVVPYNGNLQNYYHWLIEAIVPLHVIRQHMPEGSRLLLPESLSWLSAVKYQEMFDVLGFADLPSISLADEIVHLAQVIWLDFDPFQCHSRYYRSLRDDVRARLAVTGERKNRIYVARAHGRGLVNGDEFEAVAVRHGFTTYYLEQLSQTEQVKLFLEADSVLAPHGAGLSNIIFCPSGTRVIEMMPEAEVRPFFWQLAQKLGLNYAYLKGEPQTCPAGANPFNEPFAVDIGKLERLFQVMDLIA